MKTEYLTVREISQLLKCSRATVYRLIWQGRLPAAFRIGGLRRFKLTDVQAAIER